MELRCYFSVRYFCFILSVIFVTPGFPLLVGWWGMIFLVGEFLTRGFFDTVFLGILFFFLRFPASIVNLI